MEPTIPSLQRLVGDVFELEYRVQRLEAEVARLEKANDQLKGHLREQLCLAMAALEYIVQIADRGAEAGEIGVYAYDALTRISALEKTASLEKT